MISNEKIIIFSSDDWASGLKTSKYHIAIRLAEKNRILFVNSIGLRNPEMNAKDFKRIIGKLLGFFKGPKKAGRNLYVYTPIVIPFHRHRFIRIINALLLTVSLQVIKRLLDLKDPLLLIFCPNVSNVVGKLREKAAVYYCIDELKGYRQVNTMMFAEMEEDLLRKADCVIACSERLLKKKKAYNPNTYYIPHGVDWRLFRKSLDENLEIPPDISVMKKPVIGFYGFISDDWIDFDLLNYLAAKYPQWSIVLIGKSKSDLLEEIKSENIYFLGLKEFEELPKYNKAFDVAIIPFAINELTLSSNPLKLFEYLSSGKPVVSVNIPEVARFGSLVRIADTYENFGKYIEDELAQDSRELQLRRSDYMRNESWENRLEKISEIITKHAIRNEN